jgi:hypothetical protein
MQLLLVVLGTATSSLAAGMLQPTVAALQNVGSIVHGAFLVVMASLTLETSWELLAVDTGVAKQLSVVALCEAGLGLVCFDLHNIVTEAGKDENFLRFLGACQCH